MSETASFALRYFLALLPTLRSTRLGNELRPEKESLEWFGDAVLEGLLPALLSTHLNLNRAESLSCGDLLTHTLLKDARERVLSNDSLAVAFEQLGQFAIILFPDLTSANPQV
jgi:hypothetical protein